MHISYNIAPIYTNRQRVVYTCQTLDTILFFKIVIVRIFLTTCQTQYVITLKNKGFHFSIFLKTVFGSKHKKEKTDIYLYI